MAANAGETKVKLWEGICYPENMRDDWQDEIDDILQVPFAYAVHDIDHDQKSKQRKTHAHVIVVWGGNRPDLGKERVDVSASSHRPFPCLSLEWI